MAFILFYKYIYSINHHQMLLHFQSFIQYTNIIMTVFYLALFIQLGFIVLCYAYI